MSVFVWCGIESSKAIFCGDIFIFHISYLYHIWLFIKYNITYHMLNIIYHIWYLKYHICMLYLFACDVLCDEDRYILVVRIACFNAISWSVSVSGASSRVISWIVCVSGACSCESSWSFCVPLLEMDRVVDFLVFGRANFETIPLRTMCLVALTAAILKGTHLHQASSWPCGRCLLWWSMWFTGKLQKIGLLVS